MSLAASKTLALTPQAIKAETTRIGAQATVQALVSRHQWETVLRKIEAGEAAWLDIVNDLAEGTDAGSSVSLQVRLAKALPKNPAGVLKVAGMNDLLSLDNICSGPFIEPEHAFMMRYLAQTRRSLVKLEDPAVEEKRVQCLSRIEETLALEKASSH
jgi:hypothetical protein